MNLIAMHETAVSHSLSEKLIEMGNALPEVAAN